MDAKVKGSSTKNKKMKIEMGMASLVFEPRPPNFAKMHNM
jgi:hypothetical protein